MTDEFVAGKTGSPAVRPFDAAKTEASYTRTSGQPTAALFGAASADRDWAAGLVARMARGHGSAAGEASGLGAILASSGRGEAAVLVARDRGLIGVFGEVGACRRLANEQGRPLGGATREPRLEAECRGSVACLDATRRCLILASDWATPFTLYYAVVSGGVAFASHLLALARALDAEIDPTGVYEFLRLNWTLGARTSYRGINRLLPGERLTFSVDTHAVSVADDSRLWAPQDTGGGDPLEDLWEALIGAIGNGQLDADDRLGLMLSGGWDSRVLLAATLDALGPDRLSTYSHGQLDNYELRLADRLARSVGVTHTGVALEQDALGDDSFRQRLLDDAETLLYPYWRRTAAQMAADGVGTLTCGILGEVLGGHYTVMGSRTDRLRHFVTRRTGGRDNPNGPPARRLDELLRRTASWRHQWFLEPELERAWQAEVTAGLAADCRGVVQRYEMRGVTHPDLFVEAYVTEHRALQMIAKQPLSALGVTSLLLPFCDRRLLLAAGRVPLDLRLHNGASRALLRRHRPALLRFPLAATVVPAYAPILVHEMGRLVRRGADIVADTVFMRSKGRFGRSRPFGWMNFEETLRSGRALEDIADHLSWDGFDRAAIRQRLQAVRAYESHIKLGQMWTKLTHLDRVMTLRSS